jgi:ABC-type transport system involved in multi-copper enzyme maturation permease subunit
MSAAVIAGKWEAAMNAQVRHSSPGLLPVLRREFRTRLRGYTALTLLSVYLGLLLLVLFLLYDSVTGQLNLGVPLLGPQLGQAIFTGLALAVQALTFFLAPALTLDAVSREYEGRTFEMLQLSSISLLHVLLGKFVMALALLLVMLITTLPLFSVVILFGGVELLDIARVFATIFLSAALGIMLGLCCSALTRQTFTATVICYALLILLVGGTLFAANLWSLLHGRVDPPASYVVANPLSAAAAALASTRPVDYISVGSLGPLAVLGLLTTGMVEEVGGDTVVLPLYRATWVLYGGAMLLLLWIAVHAVQPMQRWRPRYEDGVLGLLLLAYVAVAWVFRAWWLAGLQAPGP